MTALKLLSAAILGVAISAPALAAGYPEKPVTVVVPFPAGGASDTTARVTTQKMQESLGQPIVVENKPGANGSLGAGQVAKAKPDGYTLIVGSIGVYAINPALYKSLPYDPTKDFDLLTVAVRTPNVLVANPSFPANNVQELVAYLKKNPEKVTFASSGAGSSDHLTAALFWQKTGTTGVHVPYKGGAPAITDLIGGHAEVSFQNLGAVSNHIKAGKLKLLAITSDKRNSAFPDTPTMKEAGVEGVEVYSWQAVAAPKGLPADVKGKLEQSLTAALNSPDVKGKFSDIGFEVVASTSGQFSEFLGQEINRWKNVVETGKITADQ
ncbi:tripartite tricarboxylate transporter substrate binding protein [Microvirga sp. BT689]|uniref:Bug family tripartite tricarboxylate transporter substrate binding protein n=1 Tax=Microvirga arvi TaxID=2778731 RepID=UPI00194DB1F1|nr:tripartite tricarboxylate transporter substrate binding protein [Microvirga arvi]MBM6581918.1 tripartite tricarboxylate transporter substrate binding protein [Microvirga arvi]